MRPRHEFAKDEIAQALLGIRRTNTAELNILVQADGGQSLVADLDVAEIAPCFVGESERLLEGTVEQQREFLDLTVRVAGPPFELDSVTKSVAGGFRQKALVVGKGFQNW
jgi:hypothetical protein